MKFILDPKAPAPVGPYSHAIRSGNLLYTSGQVPFCPKTGDVVGTAIAEQAAQTMTNLKSVLEAAGLSLSNVVRTTVFLTNLDDFAGFNAVYAQFMGDHRPARVCLEVSKIAKGALLELDAIAEFSA